MTTTRTSLTESYAEVATAGNWTAIQNTGGCDIDVILADSLPLDSALGFRFKVLDTILPTTYGDANVYIKVVTGRISGSVAITE